MAQEEALSIGTFATGLSNSTVVDGEPVEETNDVDPPNHVDLNDLCDLFGFDCNDATNKEELNNLMFIVAMMTRLREVSQDDKTSKDDREHAEELLGTVNKDRIEILLKGTSGRDLARIFANELKPRDCTSVELQPASGAEEGVVGDDEKQVEPDDCCAICLDALQGSLCTLPCSHIFHDKCIEKIRSYSIKDVCPMCRADLPPGNPDRMFSEAMIKYHEIETHVMIQKVVLGTSSYAELWSALPADQAQDMLLVNKQLNDAATQGHMDAQFFLAKMHDSNNGIGIYPDFTTAAKWYLEAAKQGHAEAQSYRAIMCSQMGRWEEAYMWHLAASEQDFTFSQGHLGDCYLFGRGVVGNSAEALRWYKIGSKKGNGDSSKMLAHMYDTGEGVEKDETMAAHFYKLFIEQEGKYSHRSPHNILAHFRLGEMHSMGLGGCLKSAAKSTSYFKICATAGHSRASAVLRKNSQMGVGSAVQIRGLEINTAFNGFSGFIIGRYAKTSRLIVDIDDGGGFFKVNPSNLLPIG